VEAGIHNLHVAISALRRSLDGVVPGRGRELVARCGDAYVLAPADDLLTDIQRVERALHVAARAHADGDDVRHTVALRLAVELYAGDVLPEDGPAEWVVEIREQLRQRVAQAAAELARLELDRGHLPVAVAAAKRSIELDPWNDASWRRLIEGHRRAGDHAQAAVTRRAYQRRLLDLGIGADGALGVTTAPELRIS
jgi:DNA-binding SARP family transcriptional activator